ncbi:hypothetical protein TIFTF001_016247 [Ficus carica]|uniref:Myb/SANT-like domain-containing protein n=1 Tax=Ficus carica TaxID=3494 RepID=A0AA88AJ99_FICCA|nr:hypothetical protein TIFTF001_016247 [Ficus carica]
MPRKASGESYVWTDDKEKLFLEKLDEYLAARGGKQPTSSVLELWATEFNTRFGGLGYDPVTDTVVCSDETWRGFVKSGTQPVMEDGICQSIGARRQANTSGVNDESGPSRSRGSTGKQKQRDATDEMTYEAMQEIANHFRGRSQSTTSSDQNTQNLCVVECMNIMKEMSVPQYQRTIMWHYFDAHPQLQRPFCLLDDEDRRGIIASVVTSQMPPPI